MNGMNRTIIGVVFGIALIYSIGSFALTAGEIISTGDINVVLFFPHIGGDGFDFDIKLNEYSWMVTGNYDKVVDFICDDLLGIGGDARKYAVLAVAIAGFVLAIIGFFSKPSLDVRGRDNPAEYLWTHRPNAFMNCILAPWGFMTGCWYKHKALVILPIILLPIYGWWSLIMTALIIIPFFVVRAVITANIRKASGQEQREYGKSTQYAVCPKCKRNFIRPNVKCKCGLVLDYPVPNIYGYKYHTCNKGHNIPCTSGNRAQLHTVCPYCDSIIETREAMPVAIAMVGAVGSGKTTMMLAMVKTLSRSAKMRDISFDAATPGISKNMIEAKDVVSPSPTGEMDSECIFIRSRTVKDREILINDISGREFEPKQGKTLFEEYFTYSDGIVFAFDPVSLSRGRGQTPMEVFESFHYMFTQINQVSPSKVSRVPFAVVASRRDITNLDHEDVRKFLIDNGQSDFVRVMESLFDTVRYFSVQSTGSECSTAAEPFWWIVGLIDGDFVKSIPVE